MARRRGHARRPSVSAAADQPLRYIESSTLLAAILEGDAEAVRSLRDDGLRVASALTFAEAGRVLVRAGRSGQLSEARQRSATLALRTFERRCYVMSVTDQILERTRRPFPVEPVRTLDAIHLATIESLGEPPILMTVLTRDDRIARVARALGYSVE